MIIQKLLTTERALSPPDGGWGWAVVFGCFCIIGCILGVLSSFGILAVDLVDSLGTSRQTIGWILSITICLSFSCGIVGCALCERYSHRTVVVFGALVSFLGLSASSFATSEVEMLMTFSIITGIGFGCMNSPALIFANVYFNKRRALAVGMASCGGGVGPLLFSPLTDFLLHEYGWRGTLMIQSAILLNCVACGLLMLPLELQETKPQNSELHNEDAEVESLVKKSVTKTSLEVEDQTQKSKNGMTRHSILEWLKSTFKLFKNADFGVFQISNFLCGIGFIVPMLYVPDRVQQQGHSSVQSAFLISIFGIANILGRVLLGALADLPWMNKWYLYSSYLVLSGVSIFFSFLSSSYSFVVTYCAVYGGFIGAYVSLSSPLLVDLLGFDKLHDSFGVTQLVKSIGLLIGPPIAGLIFDTTQSFDKSFSFAGLCMALSGFILFSIPWFVRRRKQST